MDEESTSDALSRRAFLRRIGGGGTPAAEPEDDAPKTASSEDEGTAAAAHDAEQTLTPEAARQRLEVLGVTFMPLSVGEDRLQVQCKHVGRQFGRDEMKLLKPLASKIAWLDVAATGIDDESLESVSMMHALCRLYLQRTSVEGTGLTYLTGLPQLEYLNLYGTKVDDSALEHLVAMDSLQTVYLWQTGVSQEGVEALRARRPDLSVEFGDPFFGT